MRNTNPAALSVHAHIPDLACDGTATSATPPILLHNERNDEHRHHCRTTRCIPTKLHNCVRGTGGYGIDTTSDITPALTTLGCTPVRQKAAAVAVEQRASAAPGRERARVAAGCSCGVEGCFRVLVSACREPIRHLSGVLFQSVGHRICVQTDGDILPRVSLGVDVGRLVQLFDSDSRAWRDTVPHPARCGRYRRAAGHLVKLVAIELRKE